MQSDFPIKQMEPGQIPVGNTPAKKADKIEDVGVHSLLNPIEQNKPQAIGYAEVIIVAGTSSVGKTSIIQEIKRQSQEKEWKELDKDAIGPKNIEAFWDQEHVKLGIAENDYQTFKNVLIPRENNMHLHDAVYEPSALDQDSLYIEGTTSEQKKIAKGVCNQITRPYR